MKSRRNIQTTIGGLRVRAISGKEKILSGNYAS